MKSFICWVGGKKLLRNKIIEQFPESGTYDRYIEVFGGAGWVLFAKEKHAPLEVYNDVNSNLVNLYRCVKYHPDAMQKELEYTLMSREQFRDNADRYKTGLTDIQRAASFFYVIKTSFGADLKSFGGKTSNLLSATEYLTDISKRLCGTVIENRDFEKIINTYDREKALFYLDPPYYKTEKYYGDRFNQEDHIRLKECLDNIKGKFILSYNDCDYIRDLYKDYNISGVERGHNFLAAKGGGTYKELIIKNYQ